MMHIRKNICDNIIFNCVALDQAVNVQVDLELHCRHTLKQSVHVAHATNVYEIPNLKMGYVDSIAPDKPGYRIY